MYLPGMTPADPRLAIAAAPLSTNISISCMYTSGEVSTPALVSRTRENNLFAGYRAKNIYSIQVNIYLINIDMMSIKKTLINLLNH